MWTYNLGRSKPQLQFDIQVRYLLLSGELEERDIANKHTIIEENWKGDVANDHTT
uniref:Uncharacterized protein n=1 Tax=Rhizophagus irregularis (strain DAOM 181602 / DAOM 197198 / MUCL 43194) TaxID=747089 RepID=U9TV42_RHIID